MDVTKGVAVIQLLRPIGLSFLGLFLLLRREMAWNVGAVVSRWICNQIRGLFSGVSTNSEAEELVQHKLRQRRGYFAEAGALISICDNLSSEHGDCKGRTLDLTVSMMAMSFAFLLLRSWPQWRGPWGVRVYALYCTVVSYLAFLQHPGLVILRGLEFRRELSLRLLLSIACGPWESTVGHLIYVIARCVAFPSLGAGELNLTPCGAFGAAKLAGHGDPDSLQHLREVVKSQLEPARFVNLELQMLFATSCSLALISILMSYDLQRSARLQTSEAKVDAMSQMLAYFCDATVQLTQDFDIAKPSRSLAGLLNLAANPESLCHSNFCKRIATEEERQEFVAKLTKVNEPGSATSGEPCRLNLRDAFALQVSVMVFYTCFLGLDGTPHYLIGMNEVGMRSRPLSDSEPQVSPHAGVTGCSGTEESSSDTSGWQLSDIPSVILRRVEGHFEVHASNEAFDEHVGAIREGTRLQQLFPVAAQRQKIVNMVLQAAECVETSGEALEGYLEKPLHVQGNDSTDGLRPLQRKMTMQLRASPPPTTGPQETQVTLFFFRCKRQRFRRSARGKPLAGRSLEGGSTQVDDQRPSSTSVSCSLPGSGLGAAASMQSEASNALPIASWNVVPVRRERDNQGCAASTATVFGAKAEL